MLLQCTLLKLWKLYCIVLRIHTDNSLEIASFLRQFLPARQNMTSLNQDTAPFCILNQKGSESKDCGLVGKISV